MTNLGKVRQLTSGIDGWLSDGECELLYELAKKVPSGQAILEIGSWKGKSHKTIQSCWLLHRDDRGTC